MDSAPVGICYSDDPSCERITGNRFFLEQFELQPGDNLSASSADESAAGRRIHYFRDGKELESDGLPLQRAVKENREIPATEIEIVLPSGRRWYCQASGAPIRDETGNVVGGVAVAVDITERKRNELALRESEERLALVLSAGRIAIWDRDIITGKVVWNDEHLRMMGYESGETKPGFEAWIDRIHPEDRPDAKARFERALKKGGNYTGEYRVLWPDGTVRWINVHGHVDRDPTGHPVRSYGVSVDITDRKETEKELQEQHEFIVQILHSISDGLWVYDREWHFTYVNPRGLVMAQKSIDEIIGRTVWEVFPHVKGTEFESRVRKAMDDGLPDKFEYFHEPDNIWIEHRIYPAPEGVIEFVTDITERKKMEEELRRSRDLLEKRVRERTQEISVMNTELKKSEGRFRALVTTSSDVIYTMSPDWKELRQFHGRDVVLDEELPNIDWYERYIPLEDQPKVRTAINEAIRTKTIFELEHRLLRPDGTIAWIFSRAIPILDEKGEILEWFGAATDITENKKMQEHARQSQKMEAIGNLAGGVAHDFNNILAAIIGFTEMALDDSSENSPVKKSLDNVLKSAMRGRDLVKQILSFSRKTNYERGPVSLTSLIEETAQFLRASIPANIEIKLTGATRSDVIHASSIEVQQVIMNLATNASRAMEEKGGVLEIRLNDRDVIPGSHAFRTGLKPGEYVELTVKDTGTGMSPEIMKHAFEPFFTTGVSGEGTGMGLAVVYGIVTDLNGSITVESKPGTGSTFRVLFPKIRSEALPAPTETQKISGGTENILFVDDDSMLVEWAKATLERLGYRATTLTDPARALKVFSEDPFRFDLVITDQSMPGMSGIQFAREVLRVRPEVPVILCTGHSRTASPEIARKTGIKQFLMKPLSKRELAQAIRHAIDEQ